MPQIFKVPPRLRVRGVAPSGVTNMPVMVRNRLGGLAGSINFPSPNGTPGSGFYPYDETETWGTSGPASPPTIPPPVGTPPAALTPTQEQAISTPFGQSARPWQNPTTYAGFPVTIGDSQTQKVLTRNRSRNSLIIQNLSTATAPDVASTLYVGFNNQPTANNGSLALPPGLGFYWGASDCPPADDIFVAFFGIANGGGTVILAGSVIQGTYIALP